MVGVLAHRTDHDDYLIAVLMSPNRLSRRRKDLFAVSHTGAAKFLNNQGHAWLSKAKGKESDETAVSRKIKSKNLLQNPRLKRPGAGLQFAFGPAGQLGGPATPAV
jgi:hypothetical protein